MMLDIIQIFSITPETGYTIDTFTDNGTDKASELTDNKYTLTDIQADHTISVTFKKIQYQITATAGDGGSITDPGETMWDAGAAPVYEITADQGYEIDTFTVSTDAKAALDADNRYTFPPLSSDAAISITFKTASPVMTVEPAYHNIPATAGTAVFTITIENTDTITWTASLNPNTPWLTIIPGDGSNILTVSCAANTGYARTGIITFAIWGMLESSQTVEIRQAAIISTPGDVDQNGAIDLRDAILALKAAAGMGTDIISPDADVNKDGKIGLEEAIYVLRSISSSPSKPDSAPVISQITPTGGPASVSTAVTITGSPDNPHPWK